jgi:hypothetical protein
MRSISAWSVIERSVSRWRSIRLSMSRHDWHIRAATTLLTYVWRTAFVQISRISTVEKSNKDKRLGVGQYLKRSSARLARRPQSGGRETNPRSPPSWRSLHSKHPAQSARRIQAAQRARCDDLGSVRTTLQTRVAQQPAAPPSSTMSWHPPILGIDVTAIPRPGPGFDTLSPYL